MRGATVVMMRGAATIGAGFSSRRGTTTGLSSTGFGGVGATFAIAAGSVGRGGAGGAGATRGKSFAIVPAIPPGVGELLGFRAGSSEAAVAARPIGPPSSAPAAPAIVRSDGSFSFIVSPGCAVAAA